MKPKNLVIVRAVQQGLPHAEAAARFGVTRQWVHTLIRRYENEGPDGLAPRSRAPQTRPGTTPPAKVTIRYAGQIRHLAIGRAHSGTPVLLLIHDRNVTASDMNTGEIIAEFTIDPARDYQSKTR